MRTKPKLSKIDKAMRKLVRHRFEDFFEVVMHYGTTLEFILGSEIRTPYAQRLAYKHRKRIERAIWRAIRDA